MTAHLPADRLALLRAIVAAPDDDFLRLVYADWLEENGDATQAAFIRDGIGLAAYETADAEWEALHAVGRRHGLGWLAELGVTGARPKYVRGMAEFLRYSGAADLVADAAAGLFEVVPARTLVIEADDVRHPVAEELYPLSGVAGLKSVRALRLIGYTRGRGSEPDPEPWRTFVRSPHLAGLRRLSLDDTDPAEVIELAASDALRGLRRLDVRFRTDESAVRSLRAVATSPGLKGLEELWVDEWWGYDWWHDAVATVRLLGDRFGDRWHLNERPVFGPPAPGEYADE